MLFASIDIGSSAVRLLFANVYEKKGVPIVEKASLVRIPLRLGEDVFKKGRISKSREENLMKTMMAFSLLLSAYKPVRFVACATSAMRDAKNGKEVVKRIKQQTGIEIGIINGEEEARIIAATNNIHPDKRKYSLKMYVDVGGGSTEISILKEKEMISSQSFNIGTLRMLQGNVKSSEWKAMYAYLDKYRKSFGKIYLIGSGGNINKMIKMYGAPGQNILLAKELKKALNSLSKMNLRDRMEILGLRPDRADVIVPASEIFIGIMKFIKADFACVPSIGIPDGLVHLMYKDFKKGK